MVSIVTGPYRDNLMIPPVAISDRLSSELERIVEILSFRILDWENIDDVTRKRCYKELTKRGFQNPEFTQLLQEVCDYVEYLVYTSPNKDLRNIEVGIKKWLSIFVARKVKEARQMNTLLPSDRNRYQTLLREYPELKRKIHEHLSKYGNTPGDKKMQPQLYSDGNWYVQDQYGRPVMVAPPQQSREQIYAQSQQRRYQAQQAQNYQQMPPQQGYSMPMQNPQVPQQQWGPNGYQPPQQRQQQMPPQNQNLGPVNQGYSGYNNQGQSQDPNQMGPRTSPMPQKTQGTRHSDLPPPSPQGVKSMVSFDPVPEKPAETKPSAPAPKPVSVLQKTHSGYEADYIQAHNDPTINTGLPMIFNSAHNKGVYQYNEDKRVVGFKAIAYKVDNVDYDKHETVNFFTHSRKEAPAPSKKETTATLANIQRQLFIKDTVLEAQALEGNVTGDVEGYDFNRPIQVVKTLDAISADSGFIDTMLREVSAETAAEHVINYEHQRYTGIVLKGQIRDEALSLKKCEDWIGVNEVLITLEELGLPLHHWQYMNDVLTKYINEVLKYVFNVEVAIESFNADIEDLITVLADEYDIRGEFKNYASKICKTWLYPHDLTESKDDDEPVSTFIIASDVTVLPIESSSIWLPVPVTNSVDVGELPPAAIVTLESFPALYGAIHDRFKNANIRNCQVVFVTADNREMYIHQLRSDHGYAISRV